MKWKFPQSLVYLTVGDVPALQWLPNERRPVYSKLKLLHYPHALPNSFTMLYTLSRVVNNWKQTWTCESSISYTSAYIFTGKKQSHEPAYEDKISGVLQPAVLINLVNICHWKSVTPCLLRSGGSDRQWEKKPDWHLMWSYIDIKKKKIGENRYLYSTWLGLTQLSSISKHRSISMMAMFQR